MTNVYKPNELSIRLAEEEDRAQIDTLRRAYCLGPDWDHLPTALDPSEGVLLVACLPSGRPVASARLALVETRELLIGKLGAEVFAHKRRVSADGARFLWARGQEVDLGPQHLPTVMVSRWCAETPRYDKTLRLACVRVADLMSMDDRPVGALISVSPASHPLVNQVVSLGYDVSPAYWGEEWLPGLYVTHRLLKARFERVITTLSEAQQTGPVANYHWNGPWPFQQYLPQYMQRG